MARIKRLLIFSILIILSQSSAKQFDKCGMARELLKRGIPMTELSNWVCLIESESSYRTDVVGPIDDRDGSRDWGLFQINDMYWCNGQYPGQSKNLCGRNCEDFLSDDISASFQCAMQIYDEGGFERWEGWKDKCYGRYFDLSDCDLGCNTHQY